MRALLTTATALLFLLSGPVRSAEPVNYLRDVKPLLAARCYACHGALQQKGGLRLDTAKLVREGGHSGPVVIPGKGSESLAIARVSASGKKRMPPMDLGEALSEKQIVVLRTWIDQGATGPVDEKPEADPKEHWAFRPPVRRSPPPVNDSARIRNPIDAFLAVERDKHGLTPQPAADKYTLLRRVYLDLIGLPPTRDELAAFVADSSPDAYEKVVDRLLASPQYGERWGRHWMDIWRYSDWWGLGAEVRNSQKHMWHWRDWIIESLNADKGYDQMVREMLAADELYPNDLNRLRATGFLARQYFLFNRNSWMEETIEHTSKAFLGLTMNCARCHDHKFDPISQTDYYRYRAFFEPYQVRMDEVPGEPDFTKDGIPCAFDCNLDAPTYRFVRGDERQPLKDRPLKPGLPRLLAFTDLDVRPVTLPAEAHAPGLRSFVLEDQLRAAERKITAARAALTQAKKAVANAGPQTAGDPKKTPAAGKSIFRDDFAKPNPELWEVVSGQWKHEKGRLLQLKDGDMRGVLRAKTAPPDDFEAKFKFAITGGNTYRSVGITFDVAGDNEVLVYASAYAAGQKVQISYKRGGQYLYPQEGTLNRTIKLGEVLELTVRVRGPLLNVAVNGQHALAYRLPVPRKPGKMELITYTATAEFLAFELATLPPDRPLVGGAPNGEQLKAALAVAEKALAVVEAEPAALRARAAADRAKYQQPPAANGTELAKQASRAEKTAALAAAEEANARAELELKQAAAEQKSAAEQKRTAANTALTAARKSLENPGEAYTPLRGSLKTAENNLETEVSRNKPYPTISSGRRSALASWMTDVRHPLTARVAVNHIWMRHFGKPLVPTVFDFGRKGTPPTHPELLDWLAVEFVESGWSMKHLHRLMVSSDAYRMTSSSAGAATANRTVDAENRWYWRMNPVRMEAEAIRDSLLSLAGDLDQRMGGPTVPAAEESSPRRSLYFFCSHNEHQKFLVTFDGASVLECYRRAESIVPQQALAVSNSRLSLSAAMRINAQLHDRLGEVSDAEFIKAAFETVLAVPPTAEEQKECAAALKELKAVLKGQPDAVRRARGDLIQALVNHNDFITVR